MTSRRRKNSIKFCDSIGLEVATLRPNIGLKVATLRPMFRFGKVTHTYLASTSPGLNVVWPQRRLASTSSGLNVVWPHCRWPQRRGLKVAWPQCPIGRWWPRYASSNCPETLTLKNLAWIFAWVCAKILKGSVLYIGYWITWRMDQEEAKYQNLTSSVSSIQC